MLKARSIRKVQGVEKEPNSLFLLSFRRDVVGFVKRFGWEKTLDTKEFSHPWTLLEVSPVLTCFAHLVTLDSAALPVRGLAEGEVWLNGQTAWPAGRQFISTWK
jgi:hypothetical protein